MKKRHISVTIAEKRATGTARCAGHLAPHSAGALDLTKRLHCHRAGQIEKRPEVENLGVRVRGLAPETQEAIIQQEFEKIAPVRRVNYLAGTTEAVVLFENAAVRILLVFLGSPAYSILMT